VVSVATRIPDIGPNNPVAIPIPIVVVSAAILAATPIPISIAILVSTRMPVSVVGAGRYARDHPAAEQENQGKGRPSNSVHYVIQFHAVVTSRSCHRPI
jgi:hypothetical protein